MEKLVLDIHTGEAAEFDRVEALLSALAKSGDWEEVREGARLIGLQGEHSSITLEPGSQLELSGQLCADLFCNCNDFSKHIVNAVAAYTTCPKTLGACIARGQDHAARGLPVLHPARFGGFPGIPRQR